VREISKKIDPKKISEINIGLLGHVDHGKTTLTDALTGKWTDIHSEEIKRGITIRLGYADATFYRCPKCGAYLNTDKCLKCMTKAKILRTVSFIDAPGHESLMATVITGSALIDGAILLIAANEKCPLPQTREHLTALEAVGIKNIVIVQNKIDLVSEERIKESYKEIKEFVKGTIAENAPIIPVSAQQKININYVIEAIENTIPTPKRDPKKDPKMFVVRSFDVNKPGSPPEKMIGGVLGGSLTQGILKKGQEIEIRPGIKIGNNWNPVKTKIVSLEKAHYELDEVAPGGLVGISTKLDPSFTKADGLVGNVVGLPNKLPETRFKITLNVKLLERVVGTKEMIEVKNFQLNETLMLSVGTSRSIGIINDIKGNKIKMDLKIPVCADIEDRVVLFRQIFGRWRLIGYGILVE